MSEEIRPVVVKQGQEDRDTGQSGGLELVTGVGQRNTPATRIWLGKATNAPGSRSLPHHHADTETAFYVISGHLRLYFGSGFADHIDVLEGDFAFVPPFMPHVEVNLSTVSILTVLVSRSPKDSLINLPDVDDVSLAGYRRE